MKNYRKIGMKLTPQRIAILDYLQDNREHPSAEDIYLHVSKKFPTMSFATVYNTLTALKEKGRVLELTVDPEKKRYDSNTEPHHHLICISCKRITDIHVDYELELPLQVKKSFDIKGNHVEFYGICPECKNTSERR